MSGAKINEAKGSVVCRIIAGKSGDTDGAAARIVKKRQQANANI